MKILRIYSRLPPMLGGMETHISQLTKEQIKLGHEVTVYFNLGKKVTKNDVRVSRIAVSKIKPQFVGMVLYYLIIYLKLKFSQQKFDLVHIHGDWSSLFFSRLIKKIVRAEKLCMTIHDELSDNRFSKKALSLLINYVDIIFVTGHAIADQLEKLTDQNIIIQPSGVNDIFFQVRERNFNLNPFKIIIASNLIKKKNLGLVLDIAKDLPLFNFLVAGDGPEKKYLEDRIKYEKIYNVDILGFKTASELHTLYYETNIFLIVSTKEGTPTAMLEAMACGLPIITSGAGGVKNILPDNNYIVNNYDKQSFVGSIKELAENKSQIQEISKNNQLLAISYSWKSVAKNIDNYIIEEF